MQSTAGDIPIAPPSPHQDPVPGSSSQVSEDDARSGSMGKAKPGSFSWKKGPPSCRACVTMKLKCSRTWPCTSCIKRGKEATCPGERPSNEQRIRDQSVGSELGRNGSTSAISSDDVAFPSEPTSAIPWLSGASPHQLPPLLSTNSAPQSTPSNASWEDSAAQQSIESAVGCGAGVMDVQGRAEFHGRGAGALYVIGGSITPTQEEEDATRLVFPFMASDAHILAILPTEIPDREAGQQYLESYFENVDWMYRPTSRRAAEIDFKAVYDTPNIITGVQSLHPHRLASLLLIFALAELFATPVQFEPPGVKLFNMASALLSAPPDHFMCHPNLGTVECLHLMVSFLFCYGNRDGAKGAWTLLGLCIRTAQSLGLHKDCVSWGLEREELLDRSRIWWECMTYDLLQSLNFGRPYSTPLSLVQCPAPALDPANLIYSATPTAVFHSFKYDLALLFGKVADLLSAADLPPFQQVLLLDKELKAKEQQAPSWLRLSEYGVQEGPDAAVAQRHMICLLLHKALLALHRPWFAKAVMSGEEPMLHPNAASFNACVVSARKHTFVMRSILKACPKAAYRWWFFLFHTITAAVIQASVLLRAPDCMMATDVRNDFETSYEIIQQMAERSAVARRALPVLAKLSQQMNGSFADLSFVLGLNEPAGDTSAYPNESVGESGNELPLLGSEGIWDSSMFGSDGLFKDPASMLLRPPPQTGGWSSLDWTQTDPLDQTLLFWNTDAIVSSGFSGV